MKKGDKNMKLEQNDGSLSLAGIINFLQCAGINTDLQELQFSLEHYKIK